MLVRIRAGLRGTWRTPVPLISVHLRRSNLERLTESSPVLALVRHPWDKGDVEVLAYAGTDFPAFCESALAAWCGSSEFLSLDKA
jgi:hypothetical protein